MIHFHRWVARKANKATYVLAGGDCTSVLYVCERCGEAKTEDLSGSVGGKRLARPEGQPMTDASRPAAGDSSGSDGTPPRAPNRHLTADEIAAGLPAGDSGAPRVNNEWVDNYAGREAEGTGRRSVERDLARDLRDCRAQLAAVTAERDEARISSAEAWNNFADADSVRHVTAMRAERDALAADVERLTAERNEANAHATACSKALTYETDEANELRAQLDALERMNGEAITEARAYIEEHLGVAHAFFDDVIREAVGHCLSARIDQDRLAADVERLEEERDAKQAQLVLEILDRQEFEGRWLQAAADVKKLRAAVQLALNAFEHNWCINWDDLARVLTETEATHTERGDAHVPGIDDSYAGEHVATGGAGASVQHASSEAVEGEGENEAASGIQLEADSAAEQASARTQAATPPPSDRLRSMSLSVERTLKLESQLAALRAALAYTWPGIEEERTGVTQPGGNVSIGHAMAKAALLNARAAATARDAALREEGRREGLKQLRAQITEPGQVDGGQEYYADEIRSIIDRALLATPPTKGDAT